MKSLIVLTALLALTGCIKLDVEEPDVCDTSSLGVINPPEGANNVKFSMQTLTSNQIDFSGDISKIGEFAKYLTVNVSKLTIDNSTHDLDLISNADVDISSTELPMQPLASYSSSGNNNSEINCSVLMDTNQLLQYLKDPIVLTFTLSVMSPTQPINVDNTMCISISGKADKSL